MFYFVFGNNDCFTEFNSQTQFFFFFLKTQKTILKNYSQNSFLE